MEVLPQKRYRVIEQRESMDGKQKGLSYVLKDNMPFLRAVLYLMRTVDLRTKTGSYWDMGCHYDPRGYLLAEKFLEKETKVCSWVKIVEV